MSRTTRDTDGDGAVSPDESSEADPSQVPSTAPDLVSGRDGRHLVLTDGGIEA